MKWVTFAAGLATAAVGGALWGIDGLGTCALSATQRQCPKVYDTLPAGAALVGIGGALLVSSFVMMGLDARNTDRPVATIAPLRDGAALVLEGRF
jgi:hypothetical protein